MLNKPTMKKILLFTLFINFLGFSQKMDYKEYNNFLSKYVSFTGNVNYDNIYLNKPELEALVLSFEKNVPTTTTPKPDKIAFWINSYNLHTIKLIIDNYPLNSINDVIDPFKVNFISYKGILLSLDYVENEILRKLDDPRVHFGINSASISSPILINEVFEPETLDKQLNTAARFFINDASKNQLAKDQASVSKIFQWYKNDFTASKSLVEFINQYALIKLTDATVFTYKEFDFGLNK